MREGWLADRDRERDHGSIRDVPGHPRCAPRPRAGGRRTPAAHGGDGDQGLEGPFVPRPAEVDQVVVRQAGEELERRVGGGATWLSCDRSMPSTRILPLPSCPWILPREGPARLKPPPEAGEEPIAGTPSRPATAGAAGPPAQRVGLPSELDPSQAACPCDMCRWRRDRRFPATNWPRSGASVLAAAVVAPIVVGAAVVGTMLAPAWALSECAPDAAGEHDDGQRQAGDGGQDSALHQRPPDGVDIGAPVGIGSRETRAAVETTREREKGGAARPKPPRRTARTVPPEVGEGRFGSRASRRRW